eukprot:1521451-Rhodomonas_salina.4
MAVPDISQQAPRQAMPYARSVHPEIKYEKPHSCTGHRVARAGRQHLFLRQYRTPYHRQIPPCAMAAPDIA